MKQPLVRTQTRSSDWRTPSAGGFTIQDSWCKAEGGPTTSTLFSAEEAHLAAQKACVELKQKLSSSEAEKANQLLTMSAEIDDLNRTKTNLEERLIELIRYDT